MNELYYIAGISKQAFHKSLKQEELKSIGRSKIEEIVREVRKEHPRMGSRPMYYKLRIREIGINKFEKIIKEAGLGVKQKNRRVITTYSNPYHNHYPNLTYGIKLNGINQLWVSDITYWLGEVNTYYITLMQDVYSRRIIGYHADDNMYAENNLQVLRQSINIRGIRKYKGLIHHSDKGSQYTCKEYERRLNNADIDISMAKNSIENPYAERLNGIIKNDYLAFEQIFDLPSLNAALKRVVWLYNYKRPHSELGYMTPIEFEKHIFQVNPEERKEMILYDFSDKEKILT